MGSIESVGRVMLSLAFVLGLMWIIGRWAKSRTGGKGKSRDTMTVLARQQLTRNSAVAVVQIADRALVLGITDGQVNLLSDTDPALFEPASNPGRRRLALPAVRATIADAAEPPDAGGESPAPTTRRGSRSLEGSALSAATWLQAVDALRERTVRR